MTAIIEDVEESELRLTLDGEVTYKEPWVGSDLTGKATISGNNRFELMQSTGLLDKNNVEIYEGDVVAYIDKHGQKRIGKINYANAKYYIGNFETLGYAGERYELEVIGNIWEDGDLLDSE